MNESEEVGQIGTVEDVAIEFCCCLQLLFRWVHRRSLYVLEDCARQYVIQLGELSTTEQICHGENSIDTNSEAIRSASKEVSETTSFTKRIGTK